MKIEHCPIAYIACRSFSNLKISGTPETFCQMSRYELDNNCPVHNSLFSEGNNTLTYLQKLCNCVIFSFFSSPLRQFTSACRFPYYLSLPVFFLWIIYKFGEEIGSLNTISVIVVIPNYNTGLFSYFVLVMAEILGNFTTRKK